MLSRFNVFEATDFLSSDIPAFRSKEEHEVTDTEFLVIQTEGLEEQDRRTSETSGGAEQECVRRSSCSKYRR